jgi:hypothetical protein
MDFAKIVREDCGSALHRVFPASMTIDSQTILLLMDYQITG